ncbi:MAG TPA: hypothetical protein VJ738_21645 [Steroidobacteraceae bacterium]|nr:hypothetical protein [Steroidobacteraceae bacterium]
MLQPKSVAAPVFRGALLVGAALLLCGCVTEVGYQPPYNEVSSGDATSGDGINQPPPPLPDYGQPPCPGDGYLWVPGYWAYSGGYYWVPGTWVLPPQVGFLWTPGYWGYAGGAYVWHAGYWGPHVGFYGGVHYGYGYDGDGYRGGRWEGRHFAYNRYVTHVDEHVVRYTYDERVDRRFDDDRVSYEGGRGGRVAYPTREDLRYEHEEHLPATPSQRAHIEQAERNPAFFARANNGRPPIAATSRPGQFEDRGPATPHSARFEDRGAATPRPGQFPDRGAATWHPGQFQDRGPATSHPEQFQDRGAATSHPGVGRPTPPAFHGQRPAVQQPQPHQGFAPRGGPSGHPQGRPAPEKDRRSHQRDH